ncbi:hypothetical protein ACWZHB_11835 [Nocardia sp. FBN12]|uniref:hypothetical protein n=1 Tax=Nocardia sp. FBN12 TaxID=3419766 RepID=UPI003D0583CA
MYSAAREVTTLPTAHAVLAERGRWATIEKRLLDRAGLRGIDQIIGNLEPNPASLRAAVRAAREMYQRAPRR